MRGDCVRAATECEPVDSEQRNDDRERGCPPDDGDLKHGRGRPPECEQGELVVCIANK